MSHKPLPIDRTGFLILAFLLYPEGHLHRSCLPAVGRDAPQAWVNNLKLGRCPQNGSLNSGFPDVTSFPYRPPRSIPG